MDDEAPKTNREKAQEPKLGKYWCSGCDRQLVGDWEPCPYCGLRNGPKRSPRRDVR